MKSNIGQQGLLQRFLPNNGRFKNIGHFDSGRQFMTFFQLGY